MTYPDIIKSIALELTDKCQASCPMCLRNHYGGPEQQDIKNVEITLNDFKQWFPPKFLRELNSFYCCGNLGDPAIAKDCLKIYQYVRNCNSSINMTMHTNGGMRTPDWWAEFAKIQTKIIFGIDGFEGEHEVYRKGTKWSKVIENAKAFIAKGGVAVADTIVFKHNEDRIEELKIYLESIGFSSVNIITTERFYSRPFYPVQNKAGEHLYNLEPPTNSKWQQPIMDQKIIHLVKKDNYRQYISDTTISPKCVEQKEIYITANGEVFPCCWVVDHSNFSENILDPNILILRDRLLKSKQDLMKDIGVLNLHGSNIFEIFENNIWKNKLPTHWTNDKKFVCVKQCGKG